MISEEKARIFYFELRGAALSSYERQWLQLPC